MVSSASSMKTAASFAYEVVPLGSPLGSPAPSGGVEGHCGEGHSPSSDAAGGTHGAAEASSGDGFSFVAVTSKESTLSPSRLQAKLSSANNGLNKSRTSEAFSSKLQRVRGRVVLFGVLFMMAFLALKMFFFHDESAPHAEDARAAVWPYSSRNVSPPRLPSEEKAPFSSVNILPESSPPKKYEEVLAPSTSISSSGVREESALTRVDASSTGSRGPSSTVMNGKNIAQDSLRQKCENVLFLSKRPTTPWNYTQILEQEAHSYTNSRKYQVSQIVVFVTCTQSVFLLEDCLKIFATSMTDIKSGDVYEIIRKWRLLVANFGLCVAVWLLKWYYIRWSWYFDR